MTSDMGPRVLVVEDGDEYLQNLTRFVAGPVYLQVHTGAAALAALGEQPVDVIYLDMRFDRIDRGDLLGDVGEATRQMGGSQERAYRHLQNHQGLYILQALREAGHGHLPVILAYDFSHEQARFAHLARLHPSLTWVPDAITPEAIRSRILRLSGVD
ncbi:MAG: hypothetical protein OXU20_08240 [Myxococcales bacterium]|nr:hypothetical protein [Myxococcales bacterium]